MSGDRRRTIVVTGVSRGLGRALVDGFIQHGHVVSGCARSADAIEELSHRHGRPHRFVCLDVTDEAAVRGWAEAVCDELGPPDLLVNNAAVINRNRRLWQVPAEEFARVVDVNLKGVTHVIRSFVPRMIERGRGVIVNMSSGWGRSTAAEVAPYCATKWAIEGLTQAMAQELPAGMAAVPVNPGIIDTAMLRSCFGSSAAGYPSPQQWARRAVPFLLSLSVKDNGTPLTVPG